MRQSPAKIIQFPEFGSPVFVCHGIAQASLVCSSKGELDQPAGYSYKQSKLSQNGYGHDFANSSIGAHMFSYKWNVQ